MPVYRVTNPVIGAMVKYWLRSKGLIELVQVETSLRFSLDRLVSAELDDWIAEVSDHHYRLGPSEPEIK